MTGPVSAEMRQRITLRLAEIERDEVASVLLAIESGSRAWGFHSPDSDYDVRFIYARPIDWHLSVVPGRDVIERPISDVLDLSGWDLRKTLGLILRSNAVALEWLQSPIRYRDHDAFREDLLAFGRRTLRRRPVMWHYLRLAERQYARLRDADGAVRLKRFFYVVRPALALRWLRLRPDAAVPPMNIDPLLVEADPPGQAAAEIEDLIALKRAVPEMGTTPAEPAQTAALIQTELEAARATLGTTPPEARPAFGAEADRLHRKWTRLSDAPEQES